MTGKSQGAVYAHAYFSASVEKAFAADNFGPECAGLTGVTLTAFMIESYLNYICEVIYAYEDRASKYLDDSEQVNITNTLNKKTIKEELPDQSLESRLAETLGYKHQAEVMLKYLRTAVKKALQEKFDEHLLAKKSFNELENDFRFSTLDKLKAVLKASHTTQSDYDKWLQLIRALFSARNSLAHGRTEFVQEYFEPNNVLSISKAVPSITASWLEACTLEKAKEMYESSKRLVAHINDATLGEVMPLTILKTQISVMG